MSGLPDMYTLSLAGASDLNFRQTTSEIGITVMYIPKPIPL